MANNIEFNLINNKLKVKQKMNSAIYKFLEEASGELVSQTKRRTPVDTGQLKGSWKYVINSEHTKSEIGSPLENAIWNEFGTGEYALHGDGRKTPWRYVDRHGQGHTTRGKKPQRTLQHAWDDNKQKIQERFKAVMKGALD